MVKPIIPAFQAWTCIVISVFAIVILSVLGALFAKDHHSVMGSEDDPPNGTVVATAVFGAVGIYGVFLLFCGSQAFLHQRERRRGAIALS